MKVLNLYKQRGAAMLFFVIFFVIASSSVTFLLTRSSYSDIQALRLIATSKQAYITSESALEDVLYRTMIGGYPVSGQEVMTSLAGISTTTQVYDSLNDAYLVTSVATVGSATRRGVVRLVLGAGTAFNYGLQSGNGGFRLVNSASIIGNAYSNGSVEGSGSSIIRGDVISAGATGLISKIHATGTVRANTLNDSLVEGDAYYNVVGVPSTVNGTRFSPFSPLPAPAPLPIEDSKIDQWKDTILSTGTVIPAASCISGKYTINSNTSIGNVKIECNLEIKKTGPSTIVTLTGPVWVTGNIDFVSGPEIRIAPVLGRRSVQIIADNPSNRLTSSKITISNSTQFVGSGHPSSFIMILSQNSSSELGGIETAIDVGQSSSGALILFAGHGSINIGNQIALRSVAAHLINIGNNSTITYDTGLANTLFTGGPGGGYVISDWFQE